MSQTLIYSAKVCPKVTKVKNAGGNYQVGSFQVGDCIIAPGGYFGKVTSVSKKITITWENGLSGEYTPKQMQAWNYKKFLEEKEAIAVCNSHNLTSAQELAPVLALEDSAQDSNLSESQKLMNTVAISSQNDSPMSATTVTCEVSQCEISENSGEKSTLLQLRHHASPSQSRESDKEKKTPVTVSPPSNEQLSPSSPDSSVLKTCQDSSTAQSDQDEQHSIFSTSYARLPASAMMLNGFVSVQEPLEVPLLEKDYSWLESPGALSNGKGRPPGQSKQESQLKKLKALAPGQVVNPEFLESAYNLPLGWTDPQENRSALELLAKTEQSAIAVPPSETPLTGELPPSDFAALPTSTPYVENQQLQLKAITLHEPWAYLVGIYKFFETRGWSTNYRGKIAIHAAKQQKDTKYWYEQLKDLLPPLVELPFGSIVAIADLTDCILMTEEFINQQSETELRCGNWKIGRYAWKLENVQILPEPIPTKGKQGLWNIELLIPSTQSVASIECTQQSGDAACPSCESLLIKLDDSVSGSDVGASGCGVCGWTPVSEAGARTRATNFLEETEPATTSTEKPKHRQRKGCLYKYIENKKLKSGAIASYPRVIGHRNPDNPTHWRWGFNWEEKVDGEWKGRSIGSVPLGAIALIQSMQSEGVKLEEIIGFIKRAKAKKC